MSMQLRHYTAAPFVLDREMAYEQRTPITHAKPRGLWVSVLGEDDWPSWCREENFGADRLEFEHEVTLTDGAGVIVVDTLEALKAFEAQWGIRESKSYRSTSGAFEHSWVDVSIDWQAVQREHAGIIIAPYQWAARLEHDWYYGWDVASGCIWDLTAIESVRLVSSEAVSS